MKGIHIKKGKSEGIHLNGICFNGIHTDKIHLTALKHDFCLEV